MPCLLGRSRRPAAFSGAPTTGDLPALPDDAASSPVRASISLVATTEPARIHFTGDDEADTLLAREPLALLVGFVLDQQVPLQTAFSGPKKLKERLGTLDAGDIAGTDPGRLEDAFRQKPAVHRFPGTMAKRTQELCRAIVSEYDGDASRVWTEAKDGADLKRRLLDLPGIGEMKAKTLVAVLAKRFGVQPPGWQEVAPTHMSLGDIDSAAKLEEYQAAKRAHKASLRRAPAA
jgi:uncharacterized HhH-GPD family protein